MFALLIGLYTFFRVLLSDGLSPQLAISHALAMEQRAALWLLVADLATMILLWAADAAHGRLRGRPGAIPRKHHAHELFEEAATAWCVPSIVGYIFLHLQLYFVAIARMSAGPQYWVATLFAAVTLILALIFFVAGVRNTWPLLITPGRPRAPAADPPPV